MDLLHSIELPSRIIIGDNAINSLPDVLKSAKISETNGLFIVTGPNVWRKLGYLIDTVLEKYKNVERYEVQSSTLTEAENVYREVEHYKPRVIIGFGGGKSIDIAKYVAYRSKSILISVPTSPSHDGIASPFASLRGYEKPYSMKTVRPFAIIADVNILSKAPPHLIRAGAGDLIGKLTAVRDWILAHKLKGEYYGEYAAQLALLSARHVIRYATEIGRGSKEGVRVLVEGLVSSGVAMGIAGSTRPASGSEHLFAHALEMLVPNRIAHGEQVALGTIMMMSLHGGDWRKVRKTIVKLGLPASIDSLPISSDQVIEALVIAHRLRPERYTILGETGLTRDAAEKLARSTGVIPS